MQLSDFKTSVKLVTAFVLVALIGAATGGFAIYNMNRINEADTWLYEQELVGLSMMKEANVERLRGVVALRDALIATTGQEREDAIKRVADARAKVLALLKQAETLFEKPEARQALAQLTSEWSTDETATESMLKMIRVADLATSNDALKHMKAHLVPQSIKLGNVMGDLSKRKEQDAKQTSDANDALYGTARNTTLVLILLGMATGVALGMGISRHVTRPLASAVESAQRMSEGDMTQALRAEGKDESAQLLQALERMRAQLLQIVATVRDNSESVATASAEIAQGNADLSQRTEEQAAALEQTAATMDELGSTVRNNADNAQQANQLALGASQVAARGGAVVAEVVQTMQGINESSRKIADIIGTIDGIAFQTNILALNAAVEAARAGEQGRGFAVVAGEVRSLAQRSAEAAKEIKALIGASTERVEQGTALVDRAGQTMDEVVNSIRRVTDIVGEISSASSEQSSGVSQIGEAITQMDKVTQQNAALVEESAAAAESLKMQAQQLVQAVAFFKLAR
ncbi:methyl-accepting chemotaxis protein [Roseateles sp. DAIF2]|uniref:methyl-accepting chemotaxis protein n=1 Tax=Roseateles sp. DAIF2 TaxID=2714952 RepID=UPI00201DD861|nr:methyl-accepting chemotaxis protein [Roseateles sp. DAIF2]